MTVRGDIPGPVSWPPGWSVEQVAETGSTNSDLLRAAVRGTVGDRSVLVAAHQTAGRGRLDRRWDAPPGTNLLASIHVAELPDPAASITHRVGLAIVEAVEGLLGPASAHAVELKWPNDVLLDGAKLAGVLAQRSPNAPGAVVGFGVNVRWAPPGAARLDDVLVPAFRPTPATLLAQILSAFDSLPAEVGDRYAARLATIGRVVRVELPGNRSHVGRATRVEPDGALVVADGADGERRFDVGDVVHLRDADAPVDDAGHAPPGSV